MFLCRSERERERERDALEWSQSVQAERLPSAPLAPTLPGARAPTAAVHAELCPVLLAVGLQEEDSLPLGRWQLTNVPLVIMVG